jgi:hypothetical protein
MEEGSLKIQNRLGQTHTSHPKSTLPGEIGNGGIVVMTPVGNRHGLLRIVKKNSVLRSDGKYHAIGKIEKGGER